MEKIKPAHLCYWLRRRSNDCILWAAMCVIPSRRSVSSDARLKMKPEQQQVYMQTAQLFAALSKAVRAKVGAVLVTTSGVMIPGVNGTPAGTANVCEDSHFNNRTNENDLVTKPEVIHAELNCILKAAKEGVSVIGSDVFITLSPCLSCAAMLKQSGVKKVYFREQYRDNSGVKYLEDNGVEIERI